MRHFSGAAFLMMMVVATGCSSGKESAPAPKVEGVVLEGCEIALKGEHIQKADRTVPGIAYPILDMRREDAPLPGATPGCQESLEEVRHSNATGQTLGFVRHYRLTPSCEYVGGIHSTAKQRNGFAKISATKEIGGVVVMHGSEGVVVPSGIMLATAPAYGEVLMVLLPAEQSALFEAWQSCMSKKGK